MIFEPLQYANVSKTLRASSLQCDAYFLPIDGLLRKGIVSGGHYQKETARQDASHF